MFEIDHVIQCFSVLDEVEKEEPCFSQQQKYSLYRIAFHAESFDEVQKLILQASAPNLNTEERNLLLQHHLTSLPVMPHSVSEIENYIFQLQHMTYEKNKTNRMLEELLSHSSLSEELDRLIAEAQKRPLSNPAVKNEKAEKVK